MPRKKLQNFVNDPNENNTDECSLLNTHEETKEEAPVKERGKTFTSKNPRNLDGQWQK